MMLISWDDEMAALALFLLQTTDALAINQRGQTAKTKAMTRRGWR
jgi:hypothetical protein